MNTIQSTTLNVSDSVKAFLARPKNLLIGGAWVQSVSAETFETLDPATERAICSVALAGKEDVDRAVKAARKAFESKSWSKMPPSQRSKLLWRIADLIEANADELAEIEALDNGKPVSFARGLDVNAAIEFFRYMAGWPTKLEGTTIPLSNPLAPEGVQYHCYTREEPIGVVGQIIPWNFPLLMAAWKLGPALATGCTVVLKPAEQTPLAALRLGELLIEAGVPDGVVNIVTGYGEVAGAAIVDHPGINKVAFTGSTEVGKMIVRASAGNLKRLSLELGGNSPNVIFDDADLAQAIPGCAMGLFFNSGQVCCAGSRVYVQRGIYEKVLEGLAGVAASLKIGAGLDPNTQIGPLVSRAQFDRVSAYVASGKEEGARLVTGGRRVGTEGYFMEPTILADVREDMKIVREEIFGPVMKVSVFDDIDEVIQKANDSPFGLAAAAWTRDLSKAHEFAARVEAGTVWVNCYNILDPAVPFGGFKQSGWGREMGHAVLKNYTETKSVVIQL